MNENSQRIGVFGGAFDPVHLGHLQASESFLNSNLIDRLLVLPTPVAPHKESHQQTSFAHRYQMLKLAFQNHENVVVSELETHLPKPSYTLQTIEHLQNANPDNLYFLCIGEDNLASFHKWWKYEEILNLVTLIVAGRPESHGTEQQSDILERAIFVDHDEIEISSTEIREEVQKEHLCDYVPESVADYIMRNNLYTG